MPPEEVKTSIVAADPYSMKFSAQSLFLMSSLALALPGCSGGTDLLKAPSGLVTGTLDKIANSPLPALPTADPDPVGPPTEIYRRIARGATVCWFGTHGPLRATHIFNAEAEPPSRGGRAEIVIHEKDKGMPDPRGNRAFRVQVTPQGETSNLVIENIRFPIDTGQAMIADVRRWARNDLGCSATAQTKGWDPQNKPPEEGASRPNGRDRRT